MQSKYWLSKISKALMQYGYEDIISINIWYNLIRFLDLNAWYEQLRIRIKFIFSSTKQK